MTLVAGADGCTRGWVLALRDTDSGIIELRVLETFDQILELPTRPVVLGVDMPIGLLDAGHPGGRPCDSEARKLLRSRSSCVFSPPSRAAIRALSRQEADRLNRASAPDAPGITVQAFAIFPKIRELDELMSPELQAMIHEVHPELSFLQLNGGVALDQKKKSAAGFDARIELLEQAWQRPLRDTIASFKSPGCARDDITDALAACWTAGRILAGEALRIPADEQRDSAGLRMEMLR